MAGKKLRQDHAAIAALARAHAGTRGALQIADGMTSLRQGRLDARPGDLLAAANDRVRCRELQVRARRGVEAPERLLEAPMAGERAARRGDLVRPGLVAQIRGGGIADNDAFGERRAGAAEAGAVAEAEDAGHARPSLAVEHRRELAARAVEDMAAAERAQDLAGGLEAIAEADRIH